MLDSPAEPTSERAVYPFLRLHHRFACGGAEWFCFFQAEDGIRDKLVTGVQTCALPIYPGRCLDVAASESNEHVAEAVPLGTSDPPFRVSAFLRRPPFTATSLTVATLHDDGDARDVAHHRHEVTVGSRVVR